MVSSEQVVNIKVSSFLTPTLYLPFSTPFLNKVGSIRSQSYQSWLVWILRVEEFPDA
jgi:hypothetical protein